MAIREEILNELLAGYSKPEDLLGADGIIQQLKKALSTRHLSVLSGLLPTKTITQ